MRAITLAMVDAATASTLPAPPSTPPASVEIPPLPTYASDEPRCFCSPSTPWASRRADGTWEGGTIEQRTCLACAASLSRLVAT